MWEVPNAYLRARKRRLIYTIICTACVCIAISVLSNSVVNIPLGGMLFGVFTWFIYSGEVDTLYKIHRLGGS